ncbi:ABC transporter permease [soil metagenome]
MRSDPSSKNLSWVRLLLSEHMVLAFALAYVVLLGPLVPGFASSRNFGNLTSNLLPLLVLAIGQTFVLISAGIDLSITSTIALASVVGASIMTTDEGYLDGSPLAVPAAIVAMLGVGVAVGLVNGLSVAYLKMPPFMVTLATMMGVGGLAVWYTRSEKIYNLPDSFVEIAYGSVLGIPYAVFLVGLIALVAYVFLGCTLFGRWLYALGRNPKAAAISGVPVARVVATAYVISGACAGIASILFTARLMTGSPEIAPRILLDVIAAAVIGGTSLFGGRGKISWTVYGVLLIALIDNGSNLMNLSNFMIMIVKGSVILLAALLDAVRTRFTARA